jgi:hypothetical protein
MNDKTHTDHPARHYDRTCPACNGGDTQSGELSRIQLAEIERHVLAAKDWTLFYVEKIKEAFAQAQRSETATWIRVEDRLPEGDWDVMTCSYSGYRSVTPAPDVRALWRNRERGEDCYYKAWMPLPEAPK